MGVILTFGERDLGVLFAPDVIFFFSCSRCALAKSCKSCKLGRLRREDEVFRQCLFWRIGWGMWHGINVVDELIYKIYMISRSRRRAGELLGARRLLCQRVAPCFFVGVCFFFGVGAAYNIFFSYFCILFCTTNFRATF